MTTDELAWYLRQGGMTYRQIGEALYGRNCGQEGWRVRTVVRTQNRCGDCGKAMRNMGGYWRCPICGGEWLPGDSADGREQSA